MTQRQSRYSWGADEHLVVQVSEEMSLEANFTAMAMSQGLTARGLDGIVDICPSNASLLIRFDPEVLDPGTLEATVRDVERAVSADPRLSLETRIFEVPVWYDDPFTNETGARFRDRHQRPEGNDLEFAALENDLESVDAFIEAHSASPWITSMVGFVAGLPSCSRWWSASGSWRSRSTCGRGPTPRLSRSATEAASPASTPSVVRAATRCSG